MATPSEQLADQLLLIGALAPYFRHLKKGDVDIFFERLFDLWFIRWRLKLQDYGGNIRRLNGGRKRKMAWVKEELEVTAIFAPEGPTQFDWTIYMKIAEARRGITAKRKFRDHDEDENERPQIRPRPRPRKIEPNPDSSCI